MIISLRGKNLFIDHEGNNYRLNWIEKWKQYYMIGATIMNFDTLGESGQILFAKMVDRRIQIIGQWGKGNLYEAYLYERIKRELETSA